MVRTVRPGDCWRLFKGPWFGWAHGEWRMEEASVAGESPDRSKQHESSVEPTSGSTAPVPASVPWPAAPTGSGTADAGSRSGEGADSRPVPDADPRLAVAREAVTAASRVDTATAVFSTAGVAERAAESGSGVSGSGASDTGSSGSPEVEGASQSGATEGKAGAARLRNAVAAWVAGTDDEEAGGADGASGAEDADSGSVADGASAAGSSDGDLDGDRDGESRAEAETAASPEADAGTADEAGADSPRDDATAAESPAKDDVRADGGAEDTTDGASGTAASNGKEDPPARGTDTESAGAVGVAADTGAKAEAEAADATLSAEADTTPSADGEAASPAYGEAAGDDAEPRVDQPTTTFRARPPAVDQPTTMLKLGGAEPDAKPDEKPGDRQGDGQGDGQVSEAGDKSVTPQTHSTPDPGGSSATKPDPERDAERTSTFVALKPLDAPASPKPKPITPPAEKPSVTPASETAAIPQIGPERTTQQPLPPMAPLDLLAELTNTPPPPQTPVRTIVRRVKIWTPLVLLLVVVFAVVQAVRPLPTPTLALTAEETYAFEGDKVSLPWPDEGQGWMDVNGIGTVDSFGEQQPVAIGSVAKAMTAYVILKDYPLKSGEEGKSIPVDAKAETEGGYDKDGESTLNTVKAGDTLTERQALAAIMIPSANNVARLLARWDAGSEEAFVKKMNDAAKDLGMKNTKYTDPSGLKETTVSTAEDQVKLGNQLVRMQALVDITKLPVWKDPSGRVWQNYNRLVPYNNAIGIKTGSTTRAGGNLLFAATRDVGGEIVIVVGAVLGQHKPPIIDTVNAVSKTALIAAQDALTSRKILKKGDVVGYVDDGLAGHAPVVAAKDVSAVGWAGQMVKLTLSEEGTTIPHEAKAGTKVGSLSVGDGTGDAVEIPVALQSDLTEPGYGAKLTRVS